MAPVLALVDTSRAGRTLGLAFGGAAYGEAAGARSEVLDPVFAGVIGCVESSHARARGRSGIARARAVHKT